MACMTFIRGFRRVNSLKYTKASLPTRHFCSAESNDENQSHTDARDIDENSLPRGRNLELVVSCLRVDRVIASGLGMGRRKASDYIAARKLFVNKENCKKAFLEVKEGDEIDLTLSKESDEVELSRFRVLAIDKNQTKKNKRRLSGIRFSRILMARKEFDEHYTQSGD
ncbi:unnamed protein product [Porites evermanni]|uniref:RNA-binding S4 domain-containing protein n=1 Tax=Porites evermanni TaxID=104178 RepID=A0ABN8MRG8_9CNID|nr:unnamed protein product [Porites evermanni]